MLIRIALAALLATGCAGGTVAAGYQYDYRPDLAYAGPGVRAVVGVGVPTWYSNNYYWRYSDGYWYRSRYHDRGYSYYARPPRTVVSIQRPYTYYYRQGGVLRVDRDRFDRRDRYRSDRQRYRGDRRDRGYRPRPYWRR